MKLINIKILGYCLLIAGLACVSLPIVPSGGTFKALAIRQLQSMPQQESYSRADVIDAMKNVAGHTWNIANKPPFGAGLIMFIGGILIDVGSRHKKVRPN